MRHSLTVTSAGGRAKDFCVQSTDQITKDVCVGHDMQTLVVISWMTRHYMLKPVLLYLSRVWNPASTWHSWHSWACSRWACPGRDFGLGANRLHRTSTLAT